MTVTNKKLIGNHALASAASKLRNDIIRSFFTEKTHMTQTDDWMAKSRKFMEKLRPETTYCGAGSVLHRSSSGIDTHFVDHGHHDRCQAITGNR